MASVLGQITIGYRDALGVKSSSNIPVVIDDTKTLAAITTDVLTIANAEIALSECAVTEVRFQVVPTNPGPLTPTADSDANEGLLINYNATGTNYPQEIVVPSYIDALLVNGKIDLTNATLIAFTSALTTSVAVKGSNKYLMLLTSVRDAAEVQRKLRRQATKLSRSRA